jgi:hypothetical protein
MFRGVAGLGGGFRGCGGNGYTLEYGFGSVWTGAGNWSAFGREDDGVSGGCGDVSESFGGGQGETESCGRFLCCFGFGCFGVCCFGVCCFGFDDNF